MDSEASYVNLLDILGGVNIPEVHTLRVVDGMVGQSVAQTLQFLDYVRKHSSNLTAACVINILRLILIDAKYCHYPDLDLLIFGLIGESSGKAMNQCLDNRRGGLLVRSLACEALRVWNSHIQLVEIPDKCAAMEERMKAVRSLVDSMESDTAWDSAASIFAMRLRGPQALILQKRLEKGKISNNPISGDDEVLKGSALSESECQFMLGAMRTFSALDEDVLMEEYRENGKIASVNSKKRTQDGSDQAINAKKFKVIQQEDHYQELDGIDQTEAEQAKISTRKKLLDEAISKCVSVRGQVQKVSNGRNGPQSVRQTGTLAASVSRCLATVASLVSTAERARCLAALMLWSASDEVLELIANFLTTKDQADGSVMLCFLCGAVLPRIRTLQTAASRVLVRVVECMARVRPDLVIDCLLVRSLTLWPSMSPKLVKDACTTLGVEERLLHSQAHAARKHAMELVLRLGRSVNTTVDSVLSCLCDVHEKSEAKGPVSQSWRQPCASKRDVQLTQSLDAFLSPVALCSIVGKQRSSSVKGNGQKKLSVGDKALLSPSTLDSLLENAWLPSSSSAGAHALRPAKLLIPGCEDLNAELIKGLRSLVLIAPPRTLQETTLSALVSFIDSSVGSQLTSSDAVKDKDGRSCGNDGMSPVRLHGSVTKAASDLVSSLLSRYRVEIKQTGLATRIKVLIGREGMAQHAPSLLRLLE